MKILVKTVACISLVLVLPLGAMDIEKLFEYTKDGRFQPITLLNAVKNGTITVDATNANKETALMVLAKLGEVDIARKLLNYNPNVNAADNGGRTALHLAENPVITELLLENNAMIEAKNSQGDTPLLSAILYNKPNVVETLINKDASINVQNKKGNTPLHMAILVGNSDLADLLISKGAHIGIKNKKGMAAWNLSEWRSLIPRSKKIVDLAKKIEDEARTIENMMLKVTKEGKQLVLEKLLDKYGADLYRDWIDSENNTLLHIAILNNQYKLADYIIQKFPELLNKENIKGVTPINLAILEKEKTPAFKEFLKKITTITQQK